MASGGARARSGPPPDPNALRRDRDRDGWVTLPAEGRKGRSPAWPLSKASARERKIWVREWKRPQAVMWERNGQELEVALYVRSFAAAERADATASMRTLVRQQQEALGISLPGLHRNRWTIEETTPVAGGSRQTRAPSTKGRLKVVAGGRAD